MSNITLPVNGAFGLDTNSNSNIDFSQLINNGYLNKVPRDPKGNNYLACIDTTNNNQLVLYSPIFESVQSIKPIGSFTGGINYSQGLVGY